MVDISQIAQIATGVVSILSPFMPYLVKLGQSVSKKVQDVIAERGGDLVYQQAEKVWNKIKSHYQDDAEVDAAAKMVATKPEDETRQKMLAEVLAQHLRADPAFAEELLTDIGGSERLQQVIAGHEAWIEDIEQTMAGPGHQEVRTGDKGVISGIKQKMQ